MWGYSTGDILIRFFIGAFVVFIIGIIALFIVLPLVTQDTLTATVLDKDIYTTTDCDKDGCTSLTHLTVYTDKEVIEISDSLVLWTFGEQQKYGNLKAGKTYTFKVWGFSIPMIKMYRSSYEYSEVM
jgi:hypothetical protein